MTVPKPPIDASNQSPNRGYHNGYTHRPEAIVDHITDGTDSLGWLTSPASGVSSNYLIRRDGYIYELVPPTESAWANGQANDPDLENPVIMGWEREGCNYNQRTISIEHECRKNEETTQAQWLATAQLQAWLSEQFGITPDLTHIIPHSSIDSVDRPYCSGWNEVQWDELFAMIDSWLWVGEEEGEVREPVAGDAGGYINAAGETIIVANLGGVAVAVEGVNWANVGATVANDAGERYSRSILSGAMQPWFHNLPDGSTRQEDPE